MPPATHEKKKMKRIRYMAKMEDQALDAPTDSMQLPECMMVVAVRILDEEIDVEIAKKSKLKPEILSN